MPSLTLPRSARLALAAALLAAATALTVGAQIPNAEFAARRDSLAAHIGEGVVIAFGGRTPITDFGPFYQLNAFHYLTALQRNYKAVAEKPADWLPWNYRVTLARIQADCQPARASPTKSLAA